MNKIRTGKTIIFRWSITTNGKAQSLSGRNLSLQLTRDKHSRGICEIIAPHQHGFEKWLNVSVEGVNKVVGILQGRDNVSPGDYILTLWENYALKNQTVVDTTAVTIVSRTKDESPLQEGDLEEETVDLGVGDVMFMASSGIDEITEQPSDEDGGDNVITVKLVNGKTFSLHTKNGSKGEKGDTIVPVKGVDYWTPAEANEISQVTNYARSAASEAYDNSAYARASGDYAKSMGDYAKSMGDGAKEDRERAESDHVTAVADHVVADGDHATYTADHATSEEQQTTFEASEASRAATFTSKEAERDAAVQAVTEFEKRAVLYTDEEQDIEDLDVQYLDRLTAVESKAGEIDDLALKVGDVIGGNCPIVYINEGHYLQTSGWWRANNTTCNSYVVDITNVIGKKETITIPTTTTTSTFVKWAIVTDYLSIQQASSSSEANQSNWKEGQLVSKANAVIASLEPEERTIDISSDAVISAKSRGKVYLIFMLKIGVEPTAIPFEGVRKDIDILYGAVADNTEDIEEIKKSVSTFTKNYDNTLLTNRGYVHKSTGASVTTTSAMSGFKFTDYIGIEDTCVLNVRATNFTGNAALAFYTENNESSFIGSSQDFNTTSYTSISIPEGAKYFRVSCSVNDLDLFSIKVTYIAKTDILEESVDVLEREKLFDGVAIIPDGGTILGLGASFMRGGVSGTGTSNAWLHLLGSKIGCNVYNDALGGTNICYHANRLYDGTILGSGVAPINSIDAVLIMHAHDKDVFTLDSTYKNYSAEDYETNGIVPFATTDGSSQDDSVYAMAFDYVIKKIIALFNACKTSQEYVSSVKTYMGQYVPRPYQIVLATHWHDARSIYNSSVRKLAAKWGFPLVRFDDKIGFTKKHLNPSTGRQASLEYVGNSGGASPVETINGVVYGWHPMTGGTDVFIQRKMAAIASQSFVKL